MSDQTRVPVKNSYGTVRTVPKEQLEDATLEGWTPATEAEQFGAEEGALGKVGSAVLGGARGITLGLSDTAYIEAARALGDDADAEDVRRVLRLYKEANPGESFAGEVAGNLGLAYATSGLGSSVLGGRVATGTLGRAALEGGLMQEGAQYSEDTLENHKHTAESAAVAFGLGALIGGATHLGAGMVGKRLLGRQAAKAAEVADEAVVPEAGAYRTAASPPMPASVAAEDVASQAATSGAEEAEGGVLGWLRKARDYFDVKGMGANRTDFKRGVVGVEQIEERNADISRALREQRFEGQPLTGPLVSINEQNRRILGRIAEVGNDIEKAATELDSAKLPVDLDSLRSRAAEELAKFETGPLGADMVAPTRALWEKLDAGLTAKPRFSELVEARRQVDEQLASLWNADRAARGPDRAEKALLRIRGALSEQVDLEAQRAGKQLGTTAYDDWKIANETYHDLAAARKISNHGISMGGNNLLSPTTLGAAGLAIGTLNPVAALAVPANLARIHFGNQLVAHAIDSALKMKAVTSAASSVDKAIADGTKAFVKGVKGGAGKAAPMATSEEIRAFRAAVSNPAAVTAMVGEQLGDLPKVAPKVSAEIAATASRIAAWAMHTLPKDEAPLSPFSREPRAPLSDMQRLSATSTMETLKDPTVVLERMRHHELTPEHVAALKYAYPETYNAIRVWLGRHAVELNKDMTVQQLFQLSLLWDMPLTEAALPANIRAFQATFTQTTKAPAPGSAGAPAMAAGGVTSKAESAKTEAQRLEAGQ
jgi:hypothetical protein